MHTKQKTDTPARRRLAGVVAAGLLLAQPALYAQSQAAAAAASPANPQAAETSDEVVQMGAFTVSGIRLGIETAIATKQEKVSFVESIASEDIGKLPDISIAESISRLPGLAAQRVAGRAQVISVRGLSPDFANTLLNGREQVSTGDNRGVEFDQYPSELISAVTVYKTPDASLVGQGLSGTLDLNTVRPLAFGRRVIAAGARYEMNTLDDLGGGSSDNGNRFSFTYIDQFADGKFGVAFGYARLDSPVLAQEFGNYDWNNGGRPGVPAGTSTTEGLKSFARVGDNERDGFIGVFEFRPSSQFTSVIDAYYSKFSREETARGIETNIGGYNGGLNPPTNNTSTTIRNGSLLGATVTGVFPLVRAIYNQRDDELSAIGWNNEYRTGDWILEADLSYSKAEREEINLETQAHYFDANGQPVLDTVTYDMSSGFPTVRYGLDYSNVARLAIGPTIYGAGYGKVPMVKDTLKSYKLAGSRGFNSWLDNVEFGFNWADRTKNKRQPEAGLSTNGYRAINDQIRVDNVNLGFSGAGSAVSWDVPTALATYYNPFVPSEDAFAYLIQKTWTVDEEIATYFTQANIVTQLGDVKVRGNIGFQIKDVDQSSTSKYFDNTAPAGQQVKVRTAGKTYTDVLPSMNFSFDLGNQHIVRVAAARQVARPRLDQLKSAFEFSVGSSDGRPSGSGGNPELDPWEADAFDISYEKYFGENKGYFAIAGFYKDLKTYIYDQTNGNYDFSEFTTGVPNVTTNFGNFSQPLNGNGGSLRGLEVSLSVPLNMLTEALDGFGVVASLSKNDSAITVNNTNLGSGITLPGLSKTVSNLTLYYERNGFSARISRRERSDFVGEITAFGNDRSLRFVRGEAVVDAQIGYDFQSESLKGLGLVLQVYNLNNAKYSTYEDNKAQVVEYQKYGRTFLFGANYKF